MAVHLAPRTHAIERRKLKRLPARNAAVTSTAGELDLVDLCPTGMAVRGVVRERFQVGQKHFFIVRDRDQTFEVAGEVRWFDSRRPDGTAAGIAFTEILRAEPRGIWAGVTSAD